MPNQQRKFKATVIRQEDEAVVCRFTRSDSNAAPKPLANVKFLNLFALIQKNRERAEKVKQEKSKFTKPHIKNF
jgi:hypothetical protein